MLVRVDFALPGHRYSRGFQAMAFAVEDMHEPLRRIADDLRDWIGEQFYTEGAARSSGWAPLSPRYAEWKESHYPGMPILVRTGQMRGELLDPAVFHVDRHRMVYAPISDIAGYHQFGTYKMPARPPVVVTEKDKRTIDREFLTWLRYVEKRSGV